MAEERSPTAVRQVIFDTDVLVWYFRGRESARRFIRRVPTPLRVVSALTLMELIQGCCNRAEVGEMNGFIRDNIARLVHPDEAVSHRAIALLERHAAPHGLRVVDALIAAAALQVGAALATGNARHYRVVDGLQLLAFRP